MGVKQLWTWTFVTQSSKTVWESRWPSWTPRPYCLYGCKAALNLNLCHPKLRGLCESRGGRIGLLVSMGVKQLWTWTFVTQSSKTVWESRWPFWTPRPYCLYGCKAALNLNLCHPKLRGLCESRGGRIGLLVSMGVKQLWTWTFVTQSSKTVWESRWPFWAPRFYGCKATLNLNLCHPKLRGCVKVEVAVLGSSFQWV